MRAGAGALGEEQAQCLILLRSSGCRKEQPTIAVVPDAKEEKRKCPMDEHVEATILFGIYLGGTVASLVGVFMWQGPWAALAAVGLLAVLFAMSQTIVMATNVGARTILRAISGAGR
jgi:hypothetical protein